MTDPRMTPTNDAPVTVEQCDREMAADLIKRQAGHILSESLRAGRDDGHPAVQSHARHRLAALASAPAGDGVEERDDWLRGDWYEKWQDATEDASDDLMATLEALRGRVERTILAALARPRAAVGEQSREAIARLLYGWSPAIHGGRCDAAMARGEPLGTFAYAGWDEVASEVHDIYLTRADAILALQSPPAKVEGDTK